MRIGNIFCSYEKPEPKKWITVYILETLGKKKLVSESPCKECPLLSVGDTFQFGGKVYRVLERFLNLDAIDVPERDLKERVDVYKFVIEEV